MNITRWILILCVCLLCVCLVFAVTALTALRNAVTETGQVREDARSMLEDLEELGDALREVQIPEEETTKEDAQQAGVLYDRFKVQARGGLVAVYTTSGELVQLTDITVATLPKTDRDALRDGILLNSWKEVLALIEDLSSGSGRIS